MTAPMSPARRAQIRADHTSWNGLALNCDRIDEAYDVVRELLDEVEQLTDLAAAPSSLVADDAWGSVWLYGKWAWITRCMTTPEREHAADAVARWSARLAAIDNDPDRGEPEGLRWWREDGE